MMLCFLILCLFILVSIFDLLCFFFFSSRRRHTRCLSDWSSDVCSSDLDYLTTEATNGLRHLHADWPSSEHEQPAGNGLHAGHLTVRPYSIETAQARHRRDDRLRACRQDHVFGRVANAVYVDDAGPGQAAATTEQVDALLGEPTLLAGIGVVRNHVVAPGKNRIDVDPRSRCSVVRAVHGFPGAQQRLGRDARPVGALATDQFPLDECDAQTTFGEHAGAVLARRTAADNDHIVGVAHDGSGLPACSRIMYSAYQLGQSASRFPIRFSCSPWAASARRSAPASSVNEVNVVTSASTRPGNRAVTSCNSQPLPSGSLKEANER